MNRWLYDSDYISPPEDSDPDPYITYHQKSPPVSLGYNPKMKNQILQELNYIESDIRYIADELRKWPNDHSLQMRLNQLEAEKLDFLSKLSFLEGKPAVTAIQASNPKTEQILREALEEAKEKLKEQDDLLKQLLASPVIPATIVAIRDTQVLVSVEGDGLKEVAYPEIDVEDRQLKEKITPGASVRLIGSGNALAIVDIITSDDITGSIRLVTQEGIDGQCKIDVQGETRLIRYGQGIKTPEVGDRLLVDEFCHVAIRNIGPDEKKFSFQGTTGVSWDDVGGLVEAKDALKEAIELPFKHPELYKAYGKKPIKGVMLSGPPGCGKTMLAKAVATAVADIHNKKGVDTGFIYVKGPEMLDKFVGNTEAQVRSLFARARKHHKKNGYPAVIFIDEADAILGARGSRPNMGIEATVVPQFLAEMDGLDETGAIVLISTNRPDTLDSAVTRDGRVDSKVRVTRPNVTEAADIFKLYLSKTALASGLEVDTVAKHAAVSLFNTKYCIYDLAGQDGSTIHFTLAGLVSGAMIAGMVDKATTLALRRDIESAKAGKKVKKGLTLEDLQSAAESIFNQNLHLNHQEEVKEFIEDNKLQVIDVKKSERTLTM